MSGWALAAAVLEGFALLPAATLAPGPPSGAFIDAPGLSTPFDGQPVQGISAIATDGEGGWFALADNGYGARANSADFLLRLYRVRPDFRTAQGGAGTVRVLDAIGLNDDRRVLATAIVADRDAAPRLEAGTRVLTGTDFDPESLVRAADGSFWIGDEFGPFLLHVDAQGSLLEAPIRVPGAVAPEYADDAHPANLPRSKGLEGLGASPDGSTLFPMLEGSLPGEDRLLRVYRFETATRSFAMQEGAPLVALYPLDDGATAIGALRMRDARQGLVIERDSAQGESAMLKKIYAIDLHEVDEHGVLVKHEVADLLAIDDPHDLDGDGATRFRFDHQTIESIAVLDNGCLLLVSDNNYPFGRARSSEQPDATEFIIVRIAPDLPGH